ncbi:MAG: site-2 protease family protein [Patescibacteria group bacterium]
MNDLLIIIFQLIVLIFSVMVHEVSHGALALRLGDTTAKDAGRLTLNPIKHIDPLGSVIIPLVLIIPQLFGISGPIFGWAKPVPYNPYNLKNPKKGAGIIAAAGPVSNLLIAGIFGIILRGIGFFPEVVSLELVILINIVIFINVLLAVFNLLPIPPLDGSGILFALLPTKYHAVQQFLSQHGFMILLFFIFFGFRLIMPIIEFLYVLFAGSAAIL